MDNSDSDSTPATVDNKLHLNIYYLRHVLCVRDAQVMSYAFFMDITIQHCVQLE